jgi:hypothetical protein
LAIESDPQLKLAVATLQLTVDDGYAFYAHHLASQRVDQILDLQGSNLKAIGALGNLYVGDVKKLKAIRHAKEVLVGSACYSTE